MFPDFIYLLLHRRILGNASVKRLFISNGGLFIPASSGLRSTAAYGNRQKLKDGRAPSTRSPDTVALAPKLKGPRREKSGRCDARGSETRWQRGAKMAEGS